MTTKKLSTVAKLADRMAKKLAAKNVDYAGNLGTYHNFEYAAQVAKPFDGVDRVFATMLGIKIARIAALKQSGAKPNFESKADSHGDLTGYAALWEAYEIDNG